MQIQIHDDFNLKKIIESGQCFRAKRLPDGCYRFITKRNILHLSPLRKNLWEADCTSYAWNHIWKSYFDLDTDYNSIRKNIPEDDHFLQKAAMYGKGIRILKQDPFEMLITFIISQRKSIPAIRTAVEKLCRLAGKPLSKEKDIYAFPTAHQLKKLSAEQLK